MTIKDGQRLLELRFPAIPDRLKLVRAAVSEAAASCGCTEQCRDDIVMAVDEACQNVIRHAYEGDPKGEIILDVRRQDEHMVFHLTDFATPVNEKKVRPRPLEDVRPGGLGTHFINECMDEAAFRPPPSGAGNLLRMVKKIS